MIKLSNVLNISTDFILKGNPVDNQSLSLQLQNFKNKYSELPSSFIDIMENVIGDTMKIVTTLLEGEKVDGKHEI